MIRQLTVVVCGLLIGYQVQQDTTRQSYIPPKGFVPDSATAVRIAVAIWSPIYGANHIAGEYPFVAKLHNGVWTVTGSLPPGYVGGVAWAEIAKADARILRVGHEM